MSTQKTKESIQKFIILVKKLWNEEMMSEEEMRNDRVILLNFLIFAAKSLLTITVLLAATLAIGGLALYIALNA